ncbi:hypothetical protein GALMADRAFT_240110 [Galerina marginata CBS 339.88]|uniref:Glycoside hydrolase family 5 domain-containing protein n=1 Tax=Galerina marginata (strain CBS 339.88) TaxID=685588 RepID=A0A067TF61_GALM3|nr:hypothetical protein GALMADRAFT_240110 [Galerina marginata CBS 339.88]
MVSFSFSKLSALLSLAYDLKSVAYKPIPIPGGLKAPLAPLAADVAYNVSSSGSSFPPSQVPLSSTTNGTSPLPIASSSPQAKPSGVHRPGKKHKPAKDLEANDPAADCDAAQSYDAPPILDQEFPPHDLTTANVYRYRQQQSVNLGSWYVHEDWMTPSVFECAYGTKGAEIDIAKGWGSVNSARAVLERHWDTFIQESDFAYLASIGINTVRLPIGYWSLGPEYMQGTPFESVAQVYQDAWPRIVRAINQAGKHGLGVLVDLHGAVGSQNGQQHSGMSDGQTNLFSVPENMGKTVGVLTFLTKMLAPVNNVVGIQILNEPTYVPTLEDFYTRCIEAMRAASPEAKHLPLYLHDGFNLDRFSDFLAKRKDFVVQDYHSYFVFTPSDQQESGAQHTVDVEGAIADALNRAAQKQRRNLVVDEWSSALTPQSLKDDNDADTVRREFAAAQMEVYSNATAGWAFWSYKKEDCDDDPGWCFKAAVGTSLPATFFSYGKQTSMEEVTALANEASNLIIPTASADSDARQLSLSSLNVNLHLRDSTYGPSIPHRFQAIRRQRDDHAEPDGEDQATQASSARGYKDGFTTAKVFAAYNMSKLGFIGQFVADAIEVAGPSLVVPSTEDAYGSAFWRGLQDGQSAAMGSR